MTDPSEGTILAECPTCDRVASAVVVGSYDHVLPDEGGAPVHYRLLRCTGCDGPLLVAQYRYEEADESPQRLYPPSQFLLAPGVPAAVATHYDEAAKCFSARAFTASALMCRKTIEAVCAEFGERRGSLEVRLEGMKRTGAIDAGLFEWADMLRITGNQAAHEVGGTVHAQDAADLLHFTKAIVEYVFTYRTKFLAFKDRRKRD